MNHLQGGAVGFRKLTPSKNIARIQLSKNFKSYPTTVLDFDFTWKSFNKTVSEEDHGHGVAVWQRRVKLFGRPRDSRFTRQSQRSLLIDNL